MKQKKKSLITIIMILFLLILSSCNNTDTTTQTQSNQNIYKTVLADEFKKIIDTNPNIILIDVRTSEEFDTGHLKNAKNINFYASNFKAQLNNLDKNKTYLIYCRSGSRSGKTLEIMKELNFKEVYNLNGGIKSWKFAGYQLNQ